MLATSVGKCYYSRFIDTRQREINRLAQGRMMSLWQNQDSIFKFPNIYFCLHSLQSQLVASVEGTREVHGSWNFLTPIAQESLGSATEAMWNLCSWKTSGMESISQKSYSALVPITASGHTPGEFSQSLLGVALEMSSFSSSPGDPNGWPWLSWELWVWCSGSQSSGSIKFPQRAY